MLQIGLTEAMPAMAAMTPKTRKKKPPALAMYTGSSGMPTTFLLVLPGPANCVCLW